MHRCFTHDAASPDEFCETVGLSGTVEAPSLRGISVFLTTQTMTRIASGIRIFLYVINQPICTRLLTLPSFVRIEVDFLALAAPDSKSVLARVQQIHTKVTVNNQLC